MCLRQVFLLDMTPSMPTIDRWTFRGSESVVRYLHTCNAPEASRTPRLNLWDTVPESWRAELLAVDDEDLPALSTGELTLRCEEPAPAAGSCPNPPSPRLDRA